MSNPVALSLQDADRLLKQWNCLTDQPDRARYTQLRDALLTAVDHSDNQILGICADSLDQGKVALLSYAQALGHIIDDSRLQGDSPDTVGIYIKYNPASGLLYTSSYEGTHRGVLVSCQSDIESGLNEMYGHLPLDLFLESE